MHHAGGLQEVLGRGRYKGGHLDLAQPGGDGDAVAGVGDGAEGAVFLPGPAGLVGWGREVEERIASFQANLRDIEARIKGKDEEVFLLQQGYCLHTKMVHEGHYWAHLHYR